MKTKDLDTLLENEYAYEPPIQLIEMSHHNTNPIFTHEACLLYTSDAADE